MSLRRYQNYKESGFTPLGNLPAHWGTRRLKQICDVFPSNVDKKSYDGETPISLCNYVDVYYNEKITNAISFMPATASGEQISTLTLRAGDTIITKDSETADDIAIAAYVPSDLPGVLCGYHLAIVRPKPGQNGLYVKRLFDSQYLRSCFAVLAKGLTRVGLSRYAVDNVVVPVPPPDEQSAIADFLERETSKIDALIAEQEELLALLAEKRQATISHAITQGLDADAPTRDSGVSWLGKVPEHWKVGKCGFYMKIISGFAFSSAGFVRDEQAVKLLRGINVGVGQLRWDETVYWKRTPGDGLEAYELRAGDLVIGMDRPLISDGMRVATVTEGDLPCLLLQRVACLRPTGSVLPTYVRYLLSSPMFVAHFSPNTTGVSVPHISPGQIANFVIPVPPVNEQQCIVGFLEAELSKLDRLKVASEEAITLLNERRSALITAAVTGKIDVRNAVPEELAA